MARHALTDEQWAKLEGVLPKNNGRPSGRGDRNFIDAMLWIARTEGPWRDLPARFGSWKTIYNRYLRWSRRGAWDDIFKALQLDVGLEGSMADGSVIRAHQHAAGGKGGSTPTPLDVLEAAFPPRSTPSSTVWVSLSMLRSPPGNDMK